MSKDGKKIGVALSGGGYRAAAYHIGTLRALNKLGVLEDVDVISSVSGGSITATYYMLNKSRCYAEFEKQMIQKLQKGVMCTTFLWVISVVLFILLTFLAIPSSLTIYWVVFVGITISLGWYYIFPLSRFVEKGYQKHFFGKNTFDVLPDYPVLAINATDLTTGNLFTFSQDNAYCFPYDQESGFKPSFSTQNMKVSKAVMASSCVPQFFTPIKIDNEFYRNPSNAKRPRLVDGGLYDNQGAHKFEGFDCVFRVDYAIVSDAGQSYKPSFSFNVVGVLLSSIDVMMRRIKNFQRQHNNYIMADKRVIYAYNDLSWNEYDSFLDRFVKNIKDGYVSNSVITAHGIGVDIVCQLQCNDKEVSKVAFDKCRSIIAQNIEWDELLRRTPKHHNIAISVGTNLIGLSKDKIDALISHAEWMTELQVKLHLPFLLMR